MLKNLISKGLIFSALMTLISCKGIIKDHEISFGENQVISTTRFDDKFGLPFSGNFPIVIKEIEYGAVDLAPKTEVDDFSIILTADLSSFESDIWDGFGPIDTLPNGNPFPQWITVSELLQISIPAFTELFSINLLVGFDDNRVYIGIDLNIEAVDQVYPVGLNISQDVKNKNSDYPFASIYAHGPEYDQDGNKLKKGGLTILSSFQKPNK